MKKEFDGGSFEYRLPGLSEGMGICYEIGLHNPKHMEDENKTPYYLHLQRLLDGPMKEYISDIKGVKDYGELLNKPEAKAAVLLVATEILNSLIGVSEEKKS